MSAHAQAAMLDSIHQNLIELLADFLDSESVKLDEAIGLMKDPVNREESELHIRMANAAFNEYKNTVAASINPSADSASPAGQQEHVTDEKINIEVDRYIEMISKKGYGHTLEEQRKRVMAGIIIYKNLIKEQLQSTPPQEQSGQQQFKQAAPLPSLDEANAIAADIASKVTPQLTANQEALFIAGFVECVKYLYGKQAAQVEGWVDVPKEWKEYVQKNYKEVCNIYGEVKRIASYGGSTFVIFKSGQCYRLNFQSYNQDIVTLD